MEKSKTKFYNPYPFIIRVVNDLGKPQILAPQAHCKIRGDDPGGMELDLLPKRKERVYRKELGIELEELTKKRLISLAWTVMLDYSEEELEKETKGAIIRWIKEKVGEEEARPDLPDTDENKVEDFEEVEKAEEEEEE